MSSYSFASYLNKNKAYLVVLLIQLILNSVVAAKFLKIETTKFDPKAYVAMTFVATAVVFVLWVVSTNFVEENDGLAITEIVLTVVAVMLTYMIHTFIIMKRLDFSSLKDKTGLQVLCGFNLLFTLIGAYFCVFSEKKEVTYSNDRKKDEKSDIVETLGTLENAINDLNLDTTKNKFENVLKNLDILTENVIDGKRIEEFDELINNLKEKGDPSQDIYLYNVKLRLTFIEKINDFIKALEKNDLNIKNDERLVNDIQQDYNKIFGHNSSFIKLNSDVFEKFENFIEKLKSMNNKKISQERVKGLVKYYEDQKKQEEQKLEKQKSQDLKRNLKLKHDL